MINNELELPFDWHTNEDHCVVVTTEPENEVDRNEAQAVAVIPFSQNGPWTRPLAEGMAEFVAKAMNAYVETSGGFEEWRRLLSQTIGQR